MAVGPYSWSTTAASNSTADTNVNMAEGMQPAGLNDGVRALMAGWAGWLDSVGGAATHGGSSNAYTITNPSVAAWAAYSTDKLIMLVANHTNTGAATVNVDGLGAKAIRTADSGALVAGDLVSGGSYLLRYDGTNMQIVNTIAGGSYQPLDATLTAFAAQTTGADLIWYWTGTDAGATTALTSFARTLLDDASASAARTTLGLAIGTDVQAYDAELAALAGLTSAADALPYFTGSGAAAVTTLTSFARTLLDDTTAAAFATTLGAPLLTAATNTFTGIQIISTSASFVRWQETDAPADEAWWFWAGSAGNLLLLAYNDAISAFSTPLSIQRTGTTIDEIELNATLVDLNGNIDVSGTLAVAGAATLTDDLTVSGGDITLSGTSALLTLDPTINASTIAGKKATHTGGAILTIAANGVDSLSNDQTYGTLVASIVDGTSGSEDAKWEFSTVIAGSTAVRAIFGGGMYHGSATGGDKGNNTINFGAVYDDNTLLTCFVIEYANTGSIDLGFWDSISPTGRHDAAHRFWRDRAKLDLGVYIDHWRTHGHLVGMPSREEWANHARDKLPMGDMISRLWQTVEMQAVHIAHLHERLCALEE